MQIDKLTSKFQEALSAAQSLALGRDHQFIEPTHLMQAFFNATEWQHETIIGAKWRQC
jgi:ATP-dependent Clp protease ATP-binding subunit ClpB